MQAAPFVVAQAHKMVPPEDNGGFAAHKLIDAVQAAVELPFAFGIAREARLFDELVRSEPSLALRHLFFAERELDKIPGLERRTAAAPVAKAGVVGAGTMGSGIAIAFAQAGVPVVVVDTNEEAVDKARQTVMGMFMYQVQKGRLTQEEAWKRGQSITFTDDWNELADADLVVEAVFEDPDVKREVFAKLDGIVKPEGLLASNTSTLDIDAMAAATKRPEKVFGLHFFVPANIMPLLEIVRGSATSPQTLATAFAIGKALKKKARALGQRVRVHRQPDDLRLCARGVCARRRGRHAGTRRCGDERLRLSDGAVCDERSLRPRHWAARSKTPGQGRRRGARTCSKRSSRNNGSVRKRWPAFSSTIKRSARDASRSPIRSSSNSLRKRRARPASRRVS